MQGRRVVTWGGGVSRCLSSPGECLGLLGRGGIKSRRENILQQVQLATGLNGCQPARKSQTHLCSSVGHQMGPGLVFWAGVSLGGLGKSLGGGLAAPARDTYTLPAFPRILSLVFLACFARPLSGCGADQGYTEDHSDPCQARQFSEPQLCTPLLTPNPPEKPSSSPLRGPASIHQARAAKPCVHKSPA